MAGLQGRVFGGYQLTEQIGGGGIAEVYRAQPTASGGREAVVKVVYPEFARQPGFIPNFRHIVQMTGKLASHPHILPLLAHGEDSGYLYLVTPYVKDGALRDWLARGGRLNAGDVAPFFRQLAGALGYAHSMGVAHGNLKPNNIYLFEGRHVLLGDFGLLWDIRQLDMNHSGSGAEVVEYLAPEAFSGQVTQLSDIYSLGAVLFATLVGHAPFRGARPADVYAAHTTLPTPSLAQANPNLPPGVVLFDSVIQRAMAKRPEDRFPSATLLAQAVDTVAQQAATLPQPHLPQQPQPAIPMAQASPWASPSTQFGSGAGPFSLPPGAVNGGMNGGMMPGMGAAPAGMAGVAGMGMMGARAADAGGGGVGGATSLADLNRLNPPFPPLAGAVDERMEQGRFAAVGNDPAAPPTMRMPASVMPGANGAGAANMQVNMAGAGPAMGPSSQLADAYTMRGPAFQPPNSSGALGLNALKGAGAVYADPVQNDGGIGVDGFGPQMLPAIRPPQAPQMAPQEQLAWGDEVWGAGGRNDGWSDENSAGAHAADESYWGGDSGYTGEFTGYTGAYTAERQGVGRDETGYTDYSERVDDRPFSATELGLPRLTNPALGDLPPSWQELIAEDVPPGPRQFVFEDRQGRRGAMPRTETDGQMDSQMWAAVGRGPAQTGAYTDSRQMKAVGGAQGPVENDFGDDGQFRPSVASERKPKRRRRWIPITLVALILLTLVQVLALPVVRPDLCTVSVCATVAHAIHRIAPGLGANSAATPAPFKVTPASGKITVAQGESAQATFALVNTTAQVLTWQASASQAWLVPGPASGSLAVGGALSLTLTAKPTSSVTPDTYTAQLKVQASGAMTMAPVTVTVTAGPKLVVTPTTLSFASCGTAQTVTVQNSGGGVLTYGATPSQSSAVTLGNAKGTLAAGASAQISVTVDCSAYFGQYGVTITSNSVTGGSAQVALQYT